MMTGDQSQDVVAAMCPPHSNIIVPTKSSPSTSVTCYRVTLQRTAESMEHTATDVARLGPGPGTVQEMSQGLRHQRQPSPPPRCKCGTTGDKHLCC